MSTMYVNNAVITTKENLVKDGLGIFLKATGSEPEVAAYLKYCELQGLKSPEKDNYSWARLCQIIANSISFYYDNWVEINKCSKLPIDNADYGTYIIKDWQIVDNLYGFKLNKIHKYSISDLLIHLKNIDACQPKKIRLLENITLSELIRNK